MATVQIHSGAAQITIEVSSGTPVQEVLRNSGVALPFPCGGQHHCGKCKVRIDGCTSLMVETERQLLGAQADIYRLACFCHVTGDCVIHCDASEKGLVSTQSRQVNNWTLCPIYDDGYAIAVDIGTTTVAAYLYHHTSKAPLQTCGEMNRQNSFGADVLSRIVWCNENDVRQMQSLILEQIRGMAEQLCAAQGIAREAVSTFCITGNTTMLHIFSGFSPKSLGEAPFCPLSRFGEWMPPCIPFFEAAVMYLPRCISAYVGADITCSILSSDLLQRHHPTLLADIGTNGELALWANGQLLCCSTAAGPAFEGVGISCGSTAQVGSIDHVWLEKEQPTFHVIGDGKALSVCGSGLIDSAAVLLRQGELKPNGHFAAIDAQTVEIAGSGISLTRNDIAQLQMCKGAIRAGIDTLLDTAGLTASDLGEVILCGGFGSYIDPYSAEAIGLLPKGCAECTVAIGNAAGAGAGQILQGKGCLEEGLRLAASAKLVTLSDNPLFKQYYKRAMRFPTWQERTP